MNFIKSVFYAFSMYSRIPVPNIAYDDKDTKYVLCAFSLVGAFIGFLFIGWRFVSDTFSIGTIAYILIGTAIPILVTGGFHIDGFMDTMDAVCSYKDRDEKLKILKDSHIGAFSVIMLLLYYMIYIAAFSEIKSIEGVIIVSIGFVISRALSGLGAVCFKPAVEGGSLKAVSDNSDKKTVICVLALLLIVCFAGAAVISPFPGLFVTIGVVGSFIYYKHFSLNHFGGITGDTAGYFLLICEEVIVIAAALGERF